jgi:Fe-S cluster assembly protein SufD
MTKTLVLEKIGAQEEIRVPGNAKVRVLLPFTGNAEASRLSVVLEGEGAEAEIVGLFVGAGNAHRALALETVHAAPATRGTVWVDAILADRSVFDFRGDIRILPDAQLSHGELHQRSLLLSDEARAFSVPALEIEANDVKAYHAASAAPIDELQKFFLMSRGLSERTAEEYIVRGFAHRALSAMPLELQEALSARLRTVFT